MALSISPLGDYSIRESPAVGRVEIRNERWEAEVELRWADASQFWSWGSLPCNEAILEKATPSVVRRFI
jgi:hypothetical protein